MQNPSPDERYDVAARIARQTLDRRAPDYTDEVRRLIDAGREVMRRCGTGARPRVADIVSEAELSNDGFYRHFASKDALVAAILDDGTQRLLSYLAHQMSKEATATDQVRCWVEGVLSQAADEEGAATTLAVLWNAASLGRALAVPHTTTSARLATLLRVPFAELGSDDAVLDAELVAHAVVGRLTDLLWSHRTPTSAETARLVRFCLAAATADGGVDGPGGYVDPHPRRRLVGPDTVEDELPQLLGRVRVHPACGRAADGGGERVEHDRLEHHARDRAAAEALTDAAGRLGLLEHVAEQRDQRLEGERRLRRVARQQLLGEVDHHPGRRQRLHRRLARQGRAADPVVLDDEPVDALERIGLLVDLGVEELRRGAHGLLEQGQEQLVLAAEVLVEEPQRLARTLDHLVHREVTPRLALGHELERGIEESLETVLGPGPGGEERARHRLLAAAQRLVAGHRLIHVEVWFGHLHQCSGLVETSDSWPATAEFRTRDGTVPMREPGSALSVRPGCQETVEVGTELRRPEGPVLGGEGEVQRGDDGALQVEVEDALGVLDRPPGQRGDPVCARQRLRQDGVVRTDVVDQPDLRGPLGRDAVPGQGVLLRQLEAGQEGPRDRAAIGGDQSDHHVGIGQVRALGHEDDVRQRHQTAAQSDRGPVDRRHDGHPARHHAGHDLAPVDQGLPPERLVPTQLVEVTEIASRRERPPVAGEDDGPGPGVRVDLGEQLRQSPMEPPVGGVELLGPVHADDPDRSVLLDLELVGQPVGAHEAGSPRIRAATRFRWIWDVPPMTLCARL